MLVCYFFDGTYHWYDKAKFFVKWSHYAIFPTGVFYLCARYVLYLMKSVYEFHEFENYCTYNENYFPYKITECFDILPEYPYKVCKNPEKCFDKSTPYHLFYTDNAITDNAITYSLFLIGLPYVCVRYIHKK